MAETSVCPVCEGQLLTPWDNVPRRDAALSCRNCGEHVFTFEALRNLPGMVHDRMTRARIGHAVRQVKPGAKIGTDQLDNFAANTSLPSPLESIDLLVTHLATDYEPGEADGMNAKDWCARLGCTGPEPTLWVISQAREMGLIAGTPPTNRAHYLTAQGWKRYAELMRDGAGSRHAFMAMKFGDPEVDALYRQHLRPAVAATGFELRTTNEDHKTAGLIDSRMRVEIRTARFVVCDLTHSNRGAYWEAGYAEGLGRPVFYVCRADVLKSTDKEVAPHFDANHQLIVAWDPANLQAGLSELKAVIRATLPAEAWLEDPH